MIFVACTTFGDSWSLAIDGRSSMTRSWPWLAWSSSDQSFSLNHQLCRFSTLQVFCFLILIQDCVPHMFSGMTIIKHYWSTLSTQHARSTYCLLHFAVRGLGVRYIFQGGLLLNSFVGFLVHIFARLCGSPGWFVGDILSCGLTYCPNKMVILVPVDCYEDFEINGVSCVGIKAPLVSLILWGHTSSANPRICWLCACPIVQDCRELMKSIQDSWQLISAIHEDGWTLCETHKRLQLHSFSFYLQSCYCGVFSTIS